MSSKLSVRNIFEKCENVWWFFQVRTIKKKELHFTHFNVIPRLILDPTIDSYNCSFLRLVILRPFFRFYCFIDLMVVLKNIASIYW